MRETGITRQLLSSDDVIHVTFRDLEPRRAIAIRIGKSVLGSIWLAGDDENLSADADAALRQAAPIVALHMMRHTLSVDVERHMRESYLAALLRGGEVSPTRLEQIGLPADGRFVVLAIEVMARSASSPPSAAPRLIDLVTMHLNSYERPAVGTSLAEHGDASSPERIYVLTSILDETSSARLAGIAKEVLEHAARTLGMELRGAIGHEVDEPDLIAEARRSAEDCLMLEHRPNGIVEFNEIHDKALLRDVNELVSGWRGGTSAAFRSLVEHDSKHGSEYVETLTQLMEAFGNAALVAQRLHLHPNSVRYRIKRIAEISGVDLTDGNARLALELELRARTVHSTGH